MSKLVNEGEEKSSKKGGERGGRAKQKIGGGSSMKIKTKKRGHEKRNAIGENNEKVLKSKRTLIFPLAKKEENDRGGELGNGHWGGDPLEDKKREKWLKTFPHEKLVGTKGGVGGPGSQNILITKGCRQQLSAPKNGKEEGGKNMGRGGGSGHKSQPCRKTKDRHGAQNVHLQKTGGGEKKKGAKKEVDKKETE